MTISENAARTQHVENPHRFRRGRAAGAALGLPLVVGVLAALLGAVVGLLIPPTYTAESRIAVVPTVGLTPYTAAGFPVSARATADMYARLINANQGAEIGVREGVTLEAIHLPESNVIRLQAQAGTAEAAIAGATAAANAVIDKVNRDPSLEQQIVANAAAAGEAYADAVAGVQTKAGQDAQAELQAARQLLTQELSRPTPQAQLIREAGPPTSDRVERAQMFAGIGFLAGFIGAAMLIPTQRRKTAAALRAAWASDRTYTP